MTYSIITEALNLETGVHAIKYEKQQALVLRTVGTGFTIKIEKGNFVEIQDYDEKGIINNIFILNDGYRNFLYRLFGKYNLD